MPAPLSLTTTMMDGAGRLVTVVGQMGLPRLWLTFFVPGVAGPEGCRYAEEVPCGVQA